LSGPVRAIDINDSDFLRQFLTEHGKILPARLPGLTAAQQRRVKRGIRRCRTMGQLA
jgi:ribosomal protein S18